MIDQDVAVSNIRATSLCRSILVFCFCRMHLNQSEEQISIGSGFLQQYTTFEMLMSTHVTHVHFLSVDHIAFQEVMIPLSWELWAAVSSQIHRRLGGLGPCEVGGIDLGASKTTIDML